MFFLCAGTTFSNQRIVTVMLHGKPSPGGEGLGEVSHKNHKFLLPNDGSVRLSNQGNISATISGYFTVTGIDCWLTDFQYSRLNWYTCRISFSRSLKSFRSSSSEHQVRTRTGNGNPFRIAEFFLYRILLQSKKSLKLLANHVPLSGSLSEKSPLSFS